MAKKIEVMVLITRWNLMLCECSWPPCTVRLCPHLIFCMYCICLKAGKNDKRILNSDTGIFSDSAHSLTLVLCLFYCFQKGKKTYLLIFFLNVIATKMYIFKKNGDSVKWCSIEIKREKLYRFHSRVHHSLQFPFFPHIEIIKLPCLLT